MYDMYVSSCRCRTRKRPWSKQLHRLPARFLRPWEVLEIDILDMKVTSNKGNRYLLVIVDRATKFLFAFPLPTKETLGVTAGNCWNSSSPLVYRYPYVVARVQRKPVPLAENIPGFWTNHPPSRTGHSREDGRGTARNVVGALSGMANQVGRVCGSGHLGPSYDAKREPSKQRDGIPTAFWAGSKDIV